MVFGSEEHWSAHFACKNAASKSMREVQVKVLQCQVHAEKLRHGNLITAAAHAKGRERSYFQGNNTWQ